MIVILIFILVSIGTYQTITEAGYTKDKNGNLTFLRCLVVGAFSGSVSALVSSPAYMVS